MIHAFMVHNKCTIMEWAPSRVHFIVPCDSALVVHQEYFEHFPNFNYLAGKLPSLNFSCTTIC
jgi:hypothetical protein